MDWIGTHAYHRPHYRNVKPMQAINIFLSDKLRMHPLEFTGEGLGMATGPYLVLEPDISEAELIQAIEELFTHSRSSVPARQLSSLEERAYYRAMGIATQRDLGPGLDISRVGEVYTLTPIDRKGNFSFAVLRAGEAQRVEAAGLVGAIREVLWQRELGV